MTTTTLRSRLEKEFESYCDNYLKANHFNPNDKEIADWWLDKLESEIEGRGRESLERELGKLYDSEINVDIRSFWDGGWNVRLGDSDNGYKGSEAMSYNLNEIVPAIRELACKYFPKSAYALVLTSKDNQQ